MKKRLTKEKKDDNRKKADAKNKVATMKSIIVLVPYRCTIEKLRVLLAQFPASPMPR
jgi:hypothetical protein